MKLSELAPAYRAEEQAIRGRIRLLRKRLEETEDPEEIFHLHRRIQELRPIMEQCRDLAELTERYYERGYYRNEKYRL